MQFKIPQDVQRPDTIIGPITFAQLGICLVGGAIDYALYLGLAKTYYATVWAPPVIFIALFTLAFAFLKIGDMTFTKYILYLYEFMSKPKDRVWRKTDNEYFYPSYKQVIVTGKEDTENNIDYLKESKEKKEKLKEISKILDQ
jgi:hypothetical protein